MGDATRQLPDGLNVASAADQDFLLWTADQGRLLRTGRVAGLDRARLAEEIEDLGRAEYNALESDLTIVLQHILKWDYQRGRLSRSWELTIREHRRRIERRLKASLSLAPRIDAAMAEAYRDGRDRALAETGLPDLAIDERCPYAFQDVMTRDFTLDQTRAAR